MDRQRENTQTHPAKFKLAQAFVDGKSKGFLEYFKDEDEANAWLKEYGIEKSIVIDWDAERGKLPELPFSDFIENIQECSLGLKLTTPEIVELAIIARDTPGMNTMLRHKLMMGASGPCEECEQESRIGDLLGKILGGGR